MTLRQLEVFLAVARAGSFRGAAEALHTSQPALSQHVADLERALGVRVLDRLGRRVALTEAGRLLEEHALRVFATLDGARQAVAELQGLQRGSLVIGASTTPGTYVLPGVLAAFRARYPGIEVRLHIANSAVIERRLRGNEIDLGIVGGHGLAPGEACLAAGLLDELVLIVPPGHAWAGRREIPPGDLKGVPVLMREEGSATRRVTERALERAGVPARVAMELEHTEAIKQAVMAGLGLAFVSVHAVRGEVESGRLRALRLRGLRIQRHFHVIHHEGRTLSASARALIELIERAEPPGPRPPRRTGRPDGRRPAPGRSR